mgnify:FL=1
MKKVLIITTHFAPDIHVGAKRITKFTKHLPEYGWHPSILTKEINEYHGLDESLLQELPSDLPVYRIPAWRFPKRKLPLSMVSHGVFLAQDKKKNITLRIRC